MDSFTQSRIEELGISNNRDLMNTLILRANTLTPWLTEVPERLTDSQKVSATLTVKDIIAQLVKSKCTVDQSRDLVIEYADEKKVVCSKAFLLLKVLVYYSKICSGVMAREASLLAAHMLENFAKLDSEEQTRDVLCGYVTNTSAGTVLRDSLLEYFFEVNQAYFEWSKHNTIRDRFCYFYHLSNVYVLDNFTTKQELDDFLARTYEELQKDEEWLRKVKMWKLTKAQASMMFALRDKLGATQMFPESDDGFMSEVAT